MLMQILATVTAPIIAGTFNAMRDTYVAGYIARDYCYNIGAFIRGFRNGMATEDVPEAGDTAEYELSDEQMASVALGYMEVPLDETGYSEDDNLRHFQERHDEDSAEDEPFVIECDDGLQLLSIRQLKSLGKSHKIHNYSRLSKAALKAALRLHYSA